MTEEEKVIWGKKTLSRTWKITFYWLVLLPVVLVTQVVLALVGSGVELPVELVAGGTMTATAAYMGKRGVEEWRRKHGGSSDGSS